MIKITTIEAHHKDKKVGRGLAPTAKQISAENLFSLPICVIMVLTKSLPPGGRWHAKRDGRSLRDLGLVLTLL